MQATLACRRQNAPKTELRVKRIEGVVFDQSDFRKVKIFHDNF